MDVEVAVASTSISCAVCGSPLEDRRRRYCSTVCKDKARHERIAAAARAKRESLERGNDKRERPLWAGAMVLLLISLVCLELLRRRSSD
jgi:predicted nucleic acid-binding Zn ribbon protein